MLPGVQESVREWTFTLPRHLPLWEMEFRWTPESSKGDCRGQNSMFWRNIYSIGKLLGLHHPFGHLKHELWPKERPEVKLAIWLPTTKSQELTQFPYVQIECDIPLKSFQQGIQLYFKPHFNRRSARKVMGPKAPKSQESQLWEFQDSHLGVSRQKAIWMWAPWATTKYTIREEVVASPKCKLWWALWVQVCPWFILAPKVLKLCTNHLVLVLCRSMWVVDACHSS